MPYGPAARVTDPTGHGSPLVPGPGSTNVLIGSLPAWRALMDFHACPIVKGLVPDVGGMVLMGSPTVLINSMMACRAMDLVVEIPGGPNPIVMGATNVMIGDAGVVAPSAGIPRGLPNATFASPNAVPMPAAVGTLLAANGPAASVVTSATQTGSVNSSERNVAAVANENSGQGATTLPASSRSKTQTLTVRLFDPFTAHISESPYRITVGQEVFQTKADLDGLLNLQVASIPQDCFIEWGHNEDDPETYLFSRKIYLAMDSLDETEEIRRRLHNLGYSYDAELAESVNAFQIDYQLNPTGRPADVKEMLRSWHDDPAQVKKMPGGRTSRT